jgi:hypothetical protein
VTFYRQCSFAKKTAGGGEVLKIGWVEEKGLKEGYKCNFKDKPDEWWTIRSVGSMRRPMQAVKDSERAYLHQRSMSDI